MAKPQVTVDLANRRARVAPGQARTQLRSVTQEAERLGVSKGWLYAEVRAGRFPHRKLGTRVLLDPAEVDEFLDREAVGLEEALARVDIDSLFAVVNVTHAHQVHFMFRARLLGERFGVGEESLEVDLFEPGEIPWQEIAFPSVEFALRRYLDDEAAGCVGLHLTEVPRMRL